ncbi:MAG TPA: hypothetical protein VFM25_05445 [Verrucomicrobiae bacterium]|nr:hypothetical protein [Verrucomicrobiae bacterium]
MSDTLLREKNQITIPGDIVRAAGLSPSDRIAWRFEHGEIHGRKVAPEPVCARQSRLAEDSTTGMLYFDCDLSYEEMESASLADHPPVPL